MTVASGEDRRNFLTRFLKILGDFDPVRVGGSSAGEEGARALLRVDREEVAFTNEHPVFFLMHHSQRTPGVFLDWQSAPARSQVSH